jgi:gliding motility-associated-like protein
VIKKIYLLILIVCGFVNVNATHTVGGEWFYEPIGNNNYRITFLLYRDCLNGSGSALEEDKTSSFGVYNVTKDQWVDRISLNSISEQIIPSNFVNDCIKNAPPICLNQLTFQFIQQLPNTTDEYIVLYERCCRNEAINLNNPNGNSVGATFFTTIRPKFGANHSAKFINFPPQIICINNSINYNCNATDADGDSLSYEFCEAKDFSNNSVINPDPSELAEPPFPNIPYQAGYTSSNPMRGNPQVKIDNKTGLISGNPTLIGRYVVTICCHEWRNGNLVNTNRRDFQFEVTNCSKKVIASVPIFTDDNTIYIAECDTTLVNFVSNSQGANSFFWDFGVPSLLSDTSTAQAPSYNYPDTGTYVMNLIINKGSTCADSITKLVKVYPKFTAVFTSRGLLCPDNPIAFTDSSYGTLAPPTAWRWSFGDGAKDVAQNTVHAFKSGNYNVTLLAENKFGCIDTAIQNINIKKLNLYTTSDTIVIQNVDVKIKSTGSATYSWSPNLYVNDPTICCPTFNFPFLGNYTYTVSTVTSEGCLAQDSIKFIVVKDPILFVPNAFSPNGDGVNDLMKIIQGGYGIMKYFRIYNRWGQQLFYTVDIGRGWDGTDLGKPCPMDTYYWTAAVTDIYGKTVELKGDFILIR